MTYHPLAATNATGEEYFRSIGIISSDMVPLISCPSVWTNTDSLDSDGGSYTVTESVLEYASPNSTSWVGWNLASSISKGLILAYIQPSGSDWTGVGFHNSTLPATGLQNDYQTVYAGAYSYTEIGKHSGGSFTQLGTETTFYQDDQKYSPVMGIALYVDQSNPGSEVQKAFCRSSSAQWFEVLSIGDSTFSSFQSCYFRSSGESARFITPVMVWGS